MYRDVPESFQLSQGFQEGYFDTNLGGYRPDFTCKTESKVTASVFKKTI